MEYGTLYITATPIGNLEDITVRALRILKECDHILAEDTRVTKKLLSHYGIHTKIVRMDAHKEREGLGKVLADLEEGRNIALVSDAGTPGISDPGVRLVAAAREAGCRVEAIPGASSLIAALSIAGVPADNVLFLGFIPHKKGRQTFLSNALAHNGVSAFFESTHRITKLLTELAALPDSKKVYLCRELTKIHEEVLVGSPQELLQVLTEYPEKQKGEFVVLLA